MGEILKLLQDPQSGCSQCTGIVYCMSQKDTETLSDFLNDNAMSADYYHGQPSSNVVV